MTLYFHSWQYLVRGWLYRDIVCSFLLILVRGWLYRDTIFSLLTIFGAGVIISLHYIFTPDNIWCRGDCIVTLYFHSWQYLVQGWLYRDIIFSLLTIFGAGVIISWHCMLIPVNIGDGVIISWHYIFTPDNIWRRGDYIVTLYFHSWQYLVQGWLYRDIIFSLLTIFGDGVIISCHNILTHPWQYLVRGWLYCDIIFSLLTIFVRGWLYREFVTLYSNAWQYLVRGWLYRDIMFSLLTIFGEGVIISWHIFTPEDIWWGGDYIVTLQYHFWHYHRIWHWRWLYLNIFTIQIWLQWYQGFIIHIHVFTPRNLGVEVIIFKHHTLFAVET